MSTMPTRAASMRRMVPLPRGRPALLAGASDLLQRLLKERVLILCRDLAPDQFRSDRDRQIDRLFANRLDGFRRYALNLLLSVLRDRFGFGGGLVAQFQAQRIRVVPGLHEERLGLGPRLRHQLRGVGLCLLQLLARFTGVFDRGSDGLLPVFERLEQRLPRVLPQQPREQQECRDRPDEKTWIDL